MTDDLRELRKSLESYARYVKRLRKHAKLIAAVFLWGTLFSLLTLFLLTPRYRSSTLILVQQPRIPSAYVTSTVSVDLEKRLKSVAAQIASRPRLEQILLSIYPGLRNDESGLEGHVAWMRKAILVEVKGLDTFRISYDHTSPKIAQKTTQELARLFIEDNMNDRTQQALATSRMLDEELGALKDKLAVRGEAPRAIRKDGPSEEQLASLEARLSEKLTQYTELHPDVRELRHQIRDVRGALYDPPGKRVEGARSSSGDYKMMKANYDALLSKKFEADLSVTYEKTQKETAYKILDPAYLPTIPVWPRSELIVIVGALLSLIFGIGIGLYRESCDLTIRSVDDLRSVSNIPILMTIPSIPELAKREYRNVA